jgi:hypothetical protein
MILLYLLPRNAGLANGFRGLHPGQMMHRHRGAAVKVGCVTKAQRFAYFPLSARAMARQTETDRSVYTDH